MTLKGANQVLKRGKKDEVAQEMQLLERLQKIRATLVEVREELNGNVVEELVADVAGPIVEPVVVQPEDGVAETNVEQEKTEQLKKRVVRRKKKAEEEDKELFPFYEQSLF